MGSKRDYSPEAYERHKERARDRYRKLSAQSPQWRSEQTARVRKHAESKRRFIQAIKETCGCIDCERRSPVAKLHFDHRPGTVTEFRPSEVAKCSWARLVAEIEKCEVRCIHCHARRHGAERSHA